jgi:hypothetical protein
MGFRHLWPPEPLAQRVTWRLGWFDADPRNPTGAALNGGTKRGVADRAATPGEPCLDRARLSRGGPNAAA